MDNFLIMAAPPLVLVTAIALLFVWGARGSAARKE